MTQVVEVPINSCIDAANTFPWCEFSFDPTTFEVAINEFNGFKDSTKHEKVKANKKFKCKKPDKATDNRQYVLIVTVDGELQWHPWDEQPAVSYAHLASYDPNTDVLKVLKFVEMHNPFTNPNNFGSTT